MLDNRNIIAKNVAAMLHDGDFVNLGVGIPTLVGSYIPEGTTVLLHGENGIIGQDKIAGRDFDNDTEWEKAHSKELTTSKEGHKDLCNAGNEYVTLIPGGCCFDSSISFAMARGGHLDATVLGALQVDKHGNLANWAVPGKSVNGMGGAMDLVSGAKKVIVAMEHCSKNGESKIVDECTMPLTAIGCVSVIVTELCVIEFLDGEPTVTAMAPGLTRDELLAKTDTALSFAENIGVMAVE